jgi:dTDP-4-amino-4,6-dideoxygalactose transaminase
MLAINGGVPVITEEFEKYNSLGEEEIKACTDTISTGVLSKYIGAWGEDFYGGPKVQELERLCEKTFKCKHAISVNSWTSGLICAVGSLNIEPGDEIIVPTWTMSATATAILHWNAIPIFADINPRTFNITLDTIKPRITSKTKAILAVDIFGQSCEIEQILSFAKLRNIKVITDTAQSPGSIRNGKFTGTHGDIGGFSLNYHKHIHCGEGGVILTNDSDLYDRMCLIRNHGEVVVEKMKYTNLNNILGYNFRLGELEAAIAIEQFKKLNHIVKVISERAEQFRQGLEGLKGLILPKVSSGNTHVYYVFPLLIDTNIVSIPRSKLVGALNAEGLSFFEGYQNIHLLPIYQKQIA